MKCNNCGHYINPKTGRCIHCGTKSAKPAVHRRVNISIILILRIILAVCIVCFFLPFVSVSYDNARITASDVQLAFGSVMDEVTVSMSGDDSLAYNVFAMSALVFAALSMIMSCIRKPGTLAMTTLFSFLSAAFVTLCLLTFADYYDFSKIDADAIDIKNHLTVYLVIVLHVVAGVLATSPYAVKKSVPEKSASHMHEGAEILNKVNHRMTPDRVSGVVPAITHSSADINSGTIVMCRKCGHDITGAEFCDFCGTPVRSEAVRYQSDTDYQLTAQINTHHSLRGDALSKLADVSSVKPTVSESETKEKDNWFNNAGDL